MKFRDLPIRRKLVMTTVTSSAVALCLASGGFVAWDVAQYRREIALDLEAQARILAENSAAPLAFEDSRAAGETLAALELRPRVVSACLYTASGTLFATYHRAGATCPSAPPAATAVSWTEAHILAPVMLGNDRVGTLYIFRELGDIYERLGVGALALGGILVICTLVALLISARLQRTIADPLLALADTARRVSQTKDYSLRATPTSNDEVGVVVYAFNDMLERVEQSTAVLSRANADLEREVEERARIEAERTTLLARERDANRLKDEFLATVSHELRTPLNAVLGWTRVLRATTMRPESQDRALESIERNARAQARLIEDLLEISRIVAGKLRLDVRPTDLATIVESAAEIMLPAASAKRIALTVDVRVRPAMTSGDPDRLQQVVWNLLSNAVKFTPANGRVSVTLTRIDEYVITVADTGVGIDPGFVPFVFEPFRQADGTSSREHGGLGLGLAIVRQIVELHGGTAHAHSGGRGSGATFEVRLPSALSDDALSVTLETESRALPAPEADPMMLAGIRVLVVDDDPDALELLRVSLAGYGATVVTTCSTADAIDAFNRMAPQVLVSDIGMPHEDGYALIRRVRGRPPRAGGLIPAIALTAYASADDRRATLAAGYQVHVAKPFEPADIATLVERLVKSRAHT